MDLQGIIGTLKGYLLEVSPLKKLDYNENLNKRQDELWRAKVRTFLELRFSKDSEEHALFKGTPWRLVRCPEDYFS